MLLAPVPVLLPPWCFPCDNLSLTVGMMTIHGHVSPRWHPHQHSSMSICRESETCVMLLASHMNPRGIGHVSKECRAEMNIATVMLAASLMFSPAWMPVSQRLEPEAAPLASVVQTMHPMEKTPLPASMLIICPPWPLSLLDPRCR